MVPGYVDNSPRGERFDPDDGLIRLTGFDTF